jgi:hypothetical protein
MTAAAVTVAATAELVAVAAAITAVTTDATMAAIVAAAATVTATAVGGDDNGGISDGWGHRQQSTKIGSKDTVAVATAMETAATGIATTAAGAPMTAPGIGADGIAFATAWEDCGCWLCRLCMGLCVLVACVLLTPVVLLEAHMQKCIKNLANHAYWGSPEST